MKKMIYTLTMFVITLSLVCCNIDMSTLNKAKTELVIQNQSSISIKEIEYSGRTLVTEAEHAFVLVAGGAQETYLIRFTRNQDKSYSESMTTARLNFGADNDCVNLPSHEYKLDHRYELVVTGDQADDLTLRAIVDKGKIDLNRLFGL